MITLITLITLTGGFTKTMVHFDHLNNAGRSFKNLKQLNIALKNGLKRGTYLDDSTTKQVNKVLTTAKCVAFEMDMKSSNDVFLASGSVQGLRGHMNVFDRMGR